MVSKKTKQDLLLVLISIMVQIPLALFLGHYFDQRVFMNTGYLVGSGLDPYQQHTITGIFTNPLLQGIIPRFGYFPPWALVLGLTFQLFYQQIPNLILYNFSIKIPVITANISLAFFVRYVILKSNAPRKKAQFAFLFLLFNPFTLLTTTAWGQLDTIIALLSVGSLYLLSKGKKTLCALTFGLAFSIKPIILPLLGLPLFFHKSKKQQKNAKYLAILASVIFICSALPFMIYNWQPPLNPGEINAHFKIAGGLSLFGIVEIITNTLFLPPSFELLGFLWIPALLIGYLNIYQNPPTSQEDLTQKTIGLLLIFFLTRSWLSEPNINLILPLILIATTNEKTTFRNFHFAWSIPFIFMFLNYTIPQLFFLTHPTVISDLATLDVQIRTIRLTSKFIVAILWQIFAWNYLFKLFNRKTNKNYNPR